MIMTDALTYIVINDLVEVKPILNGGSLKMKLRLSLDKYQFAEFVNDMLEDFSVDDLNTALKNRELKLIDLQTEI